MKLKRELGSNVKRLNNNNVNSLTVEVFFNYRDLEVMHFFLGYR